MIIWNLLRRTNRLGGLLILRTLTSQAIFLVGGCLLMAADQVPSSVSPASLNSSLLESRLSWCHRNSAQERGCGAALQNMEDELPETLREQGKKLSGQALETRFQGLKQLLKASGKPESEWVTSALNAWIVTLDLHAKILIAKEKEQSLADDRIVVQGAGAKLRFIDGRVLVGYIIENSGAANAGLLAGDELLRVNGVSMSGLSTTVKRNFFRDIQAPYRLEILRGEKAFAVSVEEKKFILPNVEQKAELGLGTIRIRSFDKEGVCDETRKALADLESAGARRLEIDLRDNPGGLVSEARCVAGLLLGMGQPFASLKKMENPELQGFLPSTVSSRSMGGKADVTLLTEEEKLTNLPINVRINQNTASAAEMLAAALQDNKRAKVMGSRSFGKGSMQSAFHPWDDQDLYLMATTHLIIRPSGKKIQYAGITPDLVLEKSEGKNFPREQNLTPDAMN
jgi:carboxyl-terminal processing protease